MKNKALTLEWIISTLKKSGINSKHIVIKRLENMSLDESLELILDLVSNCNSCNNEVEKPLVIHK